MMGRGVDRSIHSVTPAAIVRPTHLVNFDRLGHHVRA